MRTLGHHHREGQRLAERGDVAERHDAYGMMARIETYRARLKRAENTNVDLLKARAQRGTLPNPAQHAKRVARCPPTIQDEL